MILSSTVAVQSQRTARVMAAVVLVRGSGSYGGGVVATAAGRAGQSSAAGGIAYGSITAPVDFGSGGGNAGDSTAVVREEERFG